MLRGFCTLSGRAFFTLTTVACCLSACSSKSAGGEAGDGSAVHTGDTGGATSNGGSTASNGGATGKGGVTSNGGAATSNGGAATSNGGSPAVGMGTATAHDVAMKLGRSHFLIGMGNDLNNDHDMDGAYTVGTTLDVHYAYLVGLMGQGGWPDWNSGGTFVDILFNSAKKHGVVPMYTLYSMAAKGENNMSALTDDGYMKAYWDGAKLLFQRLAVFDDVAMVQFEPDFWGYAEQDAKNGDPSQLAVHVSSLAADCSAEPDTLVGMGKCLVLLARKYAPKTLVGFHVSEWANSDAGTIASFLLKIGVDEGDFVTTDTLDRDAGCYEAHTDPNCQRGTTGFYWDETNTTSPNFHEHLAWVKQITQGTGKAMLWWQTPFGVPSSTPGGTAGHYRDDRVHYIFGHIGEFIDAGGVGAVFGTGAGNQTYIDSDGDQFKNAVAQYFGSPTAL